MSSSRKYLIILTSLLCVLLSASTHALASTEHDDKYAIIYAYFGIAENHTRPNFITSEQFLEHISELVAGDYTILPIPNIVDKFIQKKKIEPNAIGISFDGSDKSIITLAAPILIKNNIPFTVFIASSKISDKKSWSLSWNDLRKLNDTGLVSFGLHPSSYSRLSMSNPDEIKRQINGSLSDIRKELGVSPSLFAYPYGEYTKAYQKIIKDMGFKAAFGQQSGVAYDGSNLFSLPRFTLTETFGDIDRFIMTANALPLPVSDISPEDTFLKSNIGFTLDQSLIKEQKSLDCFSSMSEKPIVTFLNNRVEIRFKNIETQKLRINCTLPMGNSDETDTRWRWLGLLLTPPQEIMEDDNKNAVMDENSQTNIE